MQEAIYADEKDKIDVQQQLTAWQTALLMNATGNYKKSIKPEMLLGGKAEEKSENTELDRDSKNRKLDELKEKFKTT